MDSSRKQVFGDVESTYLAVTLSTTLSKTLASLSSSGHIDKVLCGWWWGRERECVLCAERALEEMSG